MSNIQEKFNSFYNKALNEQQKKAVDPKDGILLVRAGAGSGKTRVITARITNLIVNHKVDPTSIIALTFTNKAAKEMKERISHFLENTTHLPYVGTFHSYCLRILKSNSHLLPYGQFSLIDDSDQEKIVKGILQKYGLIKKITVKQVLSFISRIKNDSTNTAERETILQSNETMRDLFRIYETEKRASHCLDFDDLLLETLNLFERNSTFKDSFNSKIRHLLVDEYQDTNKVQHALLKIISIKNNKFQLDSLCAVGDEDQSIYSWRGATVANIINFNCEFPTTQSITLEQNYRSVLPILNAANYVISNNTNRNPKKLWSHRDASDRIRIVTCSSSYQEGDAFALFLKNSTKFNSLNSHAILYRSHFQSRSIEEALIKYGIPYKIMGGIQFYDRLEIKDILAYLRLIINPFDRLAFTRAINTPLRGLGDKFEELFMTTWQLQPLFDFKQIAELLLTTKQLNKAKHDSLQSFVEAFEGLDSKQEASFVVTEVIKRISYYSHLKNHYDKEEAQTKIDNVKELVNGINYFEENGGQNLEGFLEEVALLQEHMNKNNEKNDYISLMTLHAAKGLEFDTVLLSGLEEGILPSAHSIYNPESLEEERRLLYVGITRAKERVLITHTNSRYAYGSMTDQSPSRFLNELPENYIQQDNIRQFDSAAIDRYFYNWLHNKKDFLDIKIESKEKTDDNSKNNSSFKKHQIVTHGIFGQGVIEKIEPKANADYLTIRFKNGIKKLDSSFVK